MKWWRTTRERDLSESALLCIMIVCEWWWWWDVWEMRLIWTDGRAQEESSCTLSRSFSHTHAHCVFALASLSLGVGDILLFVRVLCARGSRHTHTDAIWSQQQGGETGTTLSSRKNNANRKWIEEHRKKKRRCMMRIVKFWQRNIRTKHDKRRRAPLDVVRFCGGTLSVQFRNKCFALMNNFYFF